MKINSEFLGLGEKPYVIAELSANHGGSLSVAKQTIVAAKEAGASAVKIQSYTPDTMTINSNKEDFIISDGIWAGQNIYDLYSKAFTPFEWHEELFNFARNLGITIFSSPFDETAVDLLERLGAPAYKIASFEMTDHALIEYVARLGKPMLISTGMANVMEISEAMEVARSAGANDILLFHCISSYPAPIDEANLLALRTLADQFNVLVGLSDHTIGNSAAIASVALGAVAIEKHFAIDKDLESPDISFSINQKELKGLINDVNNIKLGLGTGELGQTPAENKNLVFRRSLYFVDSLKKGEIITKKHIRRIRPGFGLPPKFEKKVIGKVVLCDVDSGDRVTEENVDITIQN